MMIREDEADEELRAWLRETKLSPVQLCRLGIIPKGMSAEEAAVLAVSPTELSPEEKRARNKSLGSIPREETKRPKSHELTLVYDDEFAPSEVRLSTASQIDKIDDQAVKQIFYNLHVTETIQEVLVKVFEFGAPGSESLANLLPLSFIKVEDALFARAVAWFADEVRITEEGSAKMAMLHAYLHFVKANYAATLEDSASVQNESLILLGAACREYELIVRNKKLATSARKQIQNGKDVAAQSSKKHEVRYLRMQELVDKGDTPLVAAHQIASEFKLATKPDSLRTSYYRWRKKMLAKTV